MLQVNSFAPLAELKHTTAQEREGHQTCLNRGQPSARVYRKATRTKAITCPAETVSTPRLLTPSTPRLFTPSIWSPQLLDASTLCRLQNQFSRNVIRVDCNPAQSCRMDIAKGDCREVVTLPRFVGTEQASSMDLMPYPASIKKTPSVAIDTEAECVPGMASTPTHNDRDLAFELDGRPLSTSTRSDKGTQGEHVLADVRPLLCMPEDPTCLNELMVGIGVEVDDSTICMQFSVKHTLGVPDQCNSGLGNGNGITPITGSHAKDWEEITIESVYDDWVMFDHIVDV